MRIKGLVVAWEHIKYENWPQKFTCVHWPVVSHRRKIRRRLWGPLWLDGLSRVGYKTPFCHVKLLVEVKLRIFVLSTDHRPGNKARQSWHWDKRPLGIYIAAGWVALTSLETHGKSYLYRPGPPHDIRASRVAAFLVARVASHLRTNEPTGAFATHRR